MALLGKTIKLTGISLKGKNRIRENGDRWTVLAETDRVLFSPSTLGHWLFVSPEKCDQNHKASRWIKAEGDSDFLIE